MSIDTQEKYLITLISGSILNDQSMNLKNTVKYSVRYKTVNLYLYHLKSYWKVF